MAPAIAAADTNTTSAAELPMKAIQLATPETLQLQEEQNTISEESTFHLNIKLPGEVDLVNVIVSPNETVQEVRQLVVESIQTCHMSCFYLKFNGQRVNDFLPLSEVEGLTADSVLEVVEAEYTDREARMHVNRLRDLLGGVIKTSSTGLGIDSGLSYLAAIGGDGSIQEPNISENGELELDMARANEHVFADVDLTSSFKLVDYVPSNLDRAPPACVKSLGLSCWSPPPHTRKMRGDLLYITITTLEGEIVHITSHTTGFYVNKSTNQTFDPLPRTPSEKAFASHSLITLLRELSPKFKSQFELLQDTITKHSVLEILPAQSALLPFPWAVKPANHTADPCRVAEPFLLFGTDTTDSLRDWNDELQSHRELPRGTLQERVQRDRGMNKIHCDFAEAAAHGAIAIASGNVIPLNPTEPPQTQMYVSNNIFFSKGFDGRDTFAKLGGDEAAHVATGKDLEGVRLLNSADVEGLYTLGSAVVDYKGIRIVAQSLVPGIFRATTSSTSRIVYGSYEASTTIGADPQFHSLLGTVASRLHLAEHAVEDADGNTVSLHTSIEAKGLLGDDGRRYMLDLYRMCPVDIEWLENECGQKTTAESEADQKAFPAYPHQMVLLRPELVESYWEYRLREWLKEKAAAISAKNKNSAGQVEDKPSEDDSEKPKESTDAAESAEATNEKSKEVESVDIPLEGSAVNIPDFRLSFNVDSFTGIRTPKSEEELKEDDKAKHETDVRACSVFLRNVIVPAFLVDAVNQDNLPVDGLSLSKLMHKHGINMRYLGKLARFTEKMEGNRISLFRELCIHEMVVRSSKRILRSYLRDLPMIYVSDCVAHFFNCLLGFKLNMNPRPSHLTPKFADLPVDQQPLDYTKLTPEMCQSKLREDVAGKFRYQIPEEFFESQMRKTPVLREVALRVGVQMEAKNYCFTEEDVNLEKAAIAKMEAEKAQKLGKKKRSRTDSNNEPIQCSVTFVAEDVLNLVPVVKQAAAKSSFAGEAMEAGRLSLSQGQNELGFELLNESLMLHEQVYGFLHPETANCYASVAMMHYHHNQTEIACDLQRKATIIAERTVGLDHYETLHGYMNLGLFEYACGRPRAALRYLKHAREFWTIVYGKNHPDSGVADNNIGVILQSLGDFETSIKFFENARDLHEKTYGSDHFATASNYHLVAKAYAVIRDYKSAMANEKVAFKIFNQLLGADHPKTKDSDQYLQNLTANAVYSAKLLQEKTRRPRLPAAPAAQNVQPISVNLVDRRPLIPGEGYGSHGHMPIDELLSYINSDSKKCLRKHRGTNGKANSGK